MPFRYLGVNCRQPRWGFHQGCLAAGVGVRDAEPARARHHPQAGRSAFSRERWMGGLPVRNASSSRAVGQGPAPWRPEGRDGRLLRQRVGGLTPRSPPWPSDRGGLSTPDGRRQLRFTADYRSAAGHIRSSADGAAASPGPPEATEAGAGSSTDWIACTSTMSAAGSCSEPRRISISP